jgi:hypothetical protein
VEQDSLEDEKRIKAALGEESARIVAAAEQEISVGRRPGRRGLRDFAADLAIDQAPKQLALTPETDRALIAEFVAGVAADAQAREAELDARLCRPLCQRLCRCRNRCPKLDTAAIDRQFADFLATWEGSAELRTFFVNPAFPAPQKVAILDKLNAKLGMQKELRNLLAVLISNNRIGHVVEVAAAYRSILQEQSGHSPRRNRHRARVERKEERRRAGAEWPNLPAQKSTPASSSTIHSRRHRGAHRLHGLRRQRARPPRPLREAFD